MRSKRDRLFTFVIGVIAVTVFLITSFVALVWANGLTFDPASRNFQQTAMIAIEARITGASFLVNDRDIGSASPIQERNLPPGQYLLKITKPGYQDYTKTFQLAAGEVGIVPALVKLLALSPKTVSSQTDKTYIPVSPYEVGLIVDNGELSDKGVLVTRFSSNPLLVRRFNDGYLYQNGNELRLYFADNASDSLIKILPSVEAAKFDISPSDWTITIFEADNTTTTIFLTEPSAS